MGHRAGYLVSGLLGAALAAGLPALAAPIGDPLKLGLLNTIAAQTLVEGTVSSAATMRIDNTAAGPALDLRVPAGQAPFRVNRGVKVDNLNADQLDGLDSSAFADSAQSCPLGSVLRAFNAAGAAVCTPPPGITPVDTTGFVGSSTSMVLGGDGFPIIAYYDETNGNLKVADCADTTCASKTLTTVDSAGNVGWFTSMVLGGDGFPIIAYYDVTNANLKVADCANTTCASKTLTTVDSAGNVGQSTSMVLGGDGFPIIAYYDGTNGDLKVADCANTVCASKTLTDVDSAGNVGQSTSMVLGGDGFPIIAYWDATNGDLKVADCANTVCASKTLTTVDSAGNVGADTSMVLGGDGFPIIAYWDVTNGDLKVADCANTTCASKTLTTVDSAGNVGADTSMVLGGDGFPIIAYYAATPNDDLKVADCANTTCASKTLTTVDSTGFVGLGPSMVLGGGGFPIVAYWDATQNDLKVALL